MNETIAVIGGCVQLLISVSYFIGSLIAWWNDDELLKFRREVLFLLWMLLAVLQVNL